MNQFKVYGGGFYRYVKNNRTNKAHWLRKDTPLKRTEKDLFTKEEAEAIIEKNNSSIMRMGSVHMEAATC